MPRISLVLLRRLLAVALVALASVGAAGAGTFQVVPSSPPDTTVSSTDGAATPTPFVLSADLLLPPSQPEVLSWNQLLPIWQAAGQQYGIPWQVLAAINKVESNFGQNMGPSSAGAIGWMQFMPATWQEWGVDANGDGVADPWDATDAIYSAARYLAAAGGTTDISRGVFAYNHAQWYVDEVLQLAQQYEGGGGDFSASLEAAQQTLASAQQAVVAANATLLADQAQLATAQGVAASAVEKQQDEPLLSEQLLAQKQVVDSNLGVQQAQSAVDDATTQLASAQAALDAARQQSSGLQFASGTSSLLQAPESNDGYVFPVGGGAGVVTVGHTHHDYPAANIDAPEGTQEYALHDGVVTGSWPQGDARCGIGFTIATTDGLTWTYCHMSAIEPSVVAGAQLTAGEPVGLVGATGDATGPNLHLQLQPAIGYPQEEPWFQAFAGTAFSWSDDIQHRAAPQVVYDVVGGDPVTTPATDARNLDSTSGGVVYFNAPAQ